MNDSKRNGVAQAKRLARCAIYTRKSTEEGLDQEFNSLDAQRESAESYVKSQAHEGWICLPDRYDDGGFTGGNMDRPALAQLMADIHAGKIDAVIVYKVDRLSRSLLDFAKMMETFDRYHVSFVSVTQQFNTATSMGRLVLNVLLSFAQFEREIISERTRDKIAAARRKGKWSGGHPLLGYDVDPHGFKLVVNKPEAVRVRAIFSLYLKHRGMIPVVQELERRRWVNKRWVTRKGHARGGRRFTKTSLHRLLTNVTYTGRIKYKSEVHNGEHEAVVDRDVWDQTQALLTGNGTHENTLARQRSGAPLRGLLHCLPCGCSMTPSFSSKNKSLRYRYYVCCNAQRRGWAACPSKSIPATQIEQFVVERVGSLFQDPLSLHDAISHALQQVEAQAGQKNGDEAQQASVYDDKLQDEDERIARALSRLGSTWARLPSNELVRILRMVVERVDYDGAKAKASITFAGPGLLEVSREWTQQPEEDLT
jgi:site-specific DNA recombinase